MAYEERQLCIWSSKLFLMISSWTFVKDNFDKLPVTAQT